MCCMIFTYMLIRITYMLQYIVHTYMLYFNPYMLYNTDYHVRPRLRIHVSSRGNPFTS